MGRALFGFTLQLVRKQNRNFGLVKHFSCLHKLQCNAGDAGNANPALHSKYGEYILEVINSQSAAQLRKYNLSNDCAKEIERLRTQNGPYTSLNELSLDEETLENFCETVVNKKKEQELKKIFKKNSIIPPLQKEKLDNVNTVLGINIGINNVSWALMNKEWKLLEWNCRSYEDMPNDKNLFDMVNKGLQLVSLLPEANVYVIKENIVLKTNKNVGYIEGIVFQQQLAAILISLLSQKTAAIDSKASGFSKKMYILRPRTVLQFFNLRLGGEVISTQNLMTQLFKNEPIHEEIPQIEIDKDIQSTYETQCTYGREQMSWSLLTAITFITMLNL